MEKVVIDTNIVISAAISPYGNPAKILDMVLDREIQMYYCDGIMNEYINVLSRPRLKIPANLQFNIIKGLTRVGICINQTVSIFPLTDESDRIFYDTAKDSGAVLITGNTKHFPTESFIMTPSDFMAMLQNE